MATKVVLNRKAIDKLGEDKAVRLAAEDVAQLIRDRAADLAPGAQRGAYRRDETAVGSVSPFGHIIEFGSINNIAYAPLRRAVDALGLKLKPSAE